VIHLIISLGVPLTIRLDFSFTGCLSDNIVNVNNIKLYEAPNLEEGTEVHPMDNVLKFQNQPLKTLCQIS
jgi:hypothetical protein